MEHFTILLTRGQQNSAITNRVLALRILFPLSSILERVKNGYLSVWGKVSEHPLLCVAIDRRPPKPRLCHNKRFLNLWIRHLPLKLNYLYLIYLVMLESPVCKPLWMIRVAMITSSFLRRVENILSYKCKACILFTILSLLVGRVARTFTTPLVWLQPIRSDPWECLVANILMTDILDSFLLPLGPVHLWGIGQI